MLTLQRSSLTGSSLGGRPFSSPSQLPSGRGREARGSVPSGGETQDPCLITCWRRFQLITACSMWTRPLQTDPRLPGAPRTQSQHGSLFWLGRGARPVLAERPPRAVLWPFSFSRGVFSFEVFLVQGCCCCCCEEQAPSPVPEAEEGKSRFLKKGVEATLTPSRPPTTHGGVSPCPPPPPTCKPRRAEAPLLLTSVSCSQRRGWHVVGPR